MPDDPPIFGPGRPLILLPRRTKPGQLPSFIPLPTRKNSTLRPASPSPGDGAVPISAANMPPFRPMRYGSTFVAASSFAFRMPPAQLAPVPVSGSQKAATPAPPVHPESPKPEAPSSCLPSSANMKRPPNPEKYVASVELLTRAQACLMDFARRFGSEEELKEDIALIHRYRATVIAGVQSLNQEQEDSLRELIDRIEGRKTLLDQHFGKQANEKTHTASAESPPCGCSRRSWRNGKCKAWKNLESLDIGVDPVVHWHLMHYAFFTPAEKREFLERTKVTDSVVTSYVHLWKTKPDLLREKFPSKHPDGYRGPIPSCQRNRRVQRSDPSGHPLDHVTVLKWFLKGQDANFNVFSEQFPLLDLVDTESFLNRLDMRLEEKNLLQRKHRSDSPGLGANRANQSVSAAVPSSSSAGHCSRRSKKKPQPPTYEESISAKTNDDGFAAAVAAAAHVATDSTSSRPPGASGENTNTKGKASVRSGDFPSYVATGPGFTSISIRGPMLRTLTQEVMLALGYAPSAQQEFGEPAAGGRQTAPRTREDEKNGIGDDDTSKTSIKDKSKKSIKAGESGNTASADSASASLTAQGQTHKLNTKKPAGGHRAAAKVAKTSHLASIEEEIESE